MNAYIRDGASSSGALNYIPEDSEEQMISPQTTVREKEISHFYLTSNWFCKWHDIFSADVWIL